MLRGWDLPIQANISVSFNTKLIPFNLVIAAVCPLAELPTYIYTALPTCASKSDPFASSRPRRLPATRSDRQPPPRPDKSKISFLLG
jgi:hypothetical protein